MGVCVCSVISASSVFFPPLPIPEVQKVGRRRQRGGKDQRRWMDREGKPKKVQAMHGYSSASEYVCVLHVKRVFVSPELFRVEKGPQPNSLLHESGRRKEACRKDFQPRPAAAVVLYCSVDREASSLLKKRKSSWGEKRQGKSGWVRGW